MGTTPVRGQIVEVALPKTRMWSQPRMVGIIVAATGGSNAQIFVFGDNDIPSVQVNVPAKGEKGDDLGWWEPIDAALHTQMDDIEARLAKVESARSSGRGSR